MAGTAAPCRRGRAAPHAAGPPFPCVDKEASPSLCPLLSPHSPSLLRGFPPQTLAVSSPGPPLSSRSPLIPTVRAPADDAIVTASPCCSSPPAESSREALSCEQAAVPPRLRPRRRGPSRRRPALPGLAVRAFGLWVSCCCRAPLLRPPSSLCAAPSPCTVGRRRNMVAGARSGDHLVNAAAPPTRLRPL